MSVRAAPIDLKHFTQPPSSDFVPEILQAPLMATTSRTQAIKYLDRMVEGLLQGMTRRNPPMWRANLQSMQEALNESEDWHRSFFYITTESEYAGLTLLTRLKLRIWNAETIQMANQISGNKPLIEGIRYMLPDYDGVLDFARPAERKNKAHNEE